MLSSSVSGFNSWGFPADLTTVDSGRAPLVPAAAERAADLPSRGAHFWEMPR